MGPQRGGRLTTSANLVVVCVFLGLMPLAAAPAATPRPERIQDMPASAPAATREMPDAEDADETEHAEKAERARDANDPNSADADDAEGEEEGSMAHLGKSTGILTLALLLVTVGLAVFQRFRRRAMHDWHKITGCLALLTGIVHALIMLLG